MPPLKGTYVKYDETEDNKNFVLRIAHAVIYQWDDLPEAARRLILNQAPLMGGKQQAQLSQAIASFIDEHKGEK